MTTLARGWNRLTLPGKIVFTAIPVLIALTIGLAELTFRSREIGEYTFNFFEAFAAATVIYIAVAMTANRVMAYVERRVAVPGYISGGK